MKMMMISIALSTFETESNFAGAPICTMKRARVTQINVVTISSHYFPIHFNPISTQYY